MVMVEQLGHSALPSQFLVGGFRIWLFLRVIHVPKREPYIVRSVLSGYKWTAIKSMLPKSCAAFGVALTVVCSMASFGYAMATSRRIAAREIRWLTVRTRAIGDRHADDSTDD